MATATKQDYKVVSADDHMDMTTLPPKLWEERLPTNWRARAPKVVPEPTGNIWMVDGKPLGPSGRPKQGTYVPSAIERAGIQDSGFRPSTPELRLQDMDRDGVYSHIIYGPPTGIRVDDQALKAECLKVYNDWSHEFNGVDPDRLSLLAYLPMHDPKAAADELRRVAKLNIKGAISSYFEAGVPVYEDAWETLWQAAGDTQIPLSFHLGGGLHTINPTKTSMVGSWKIRVFAAVSPMQLDEGLAIMVFSGALDRHQKMKLVLGESGLGWVPYVLERMDKEFHNHKVKDITLSALPSEIFRRQCYATFEDDHLGIKLISYIGANNVMWASDYPHPDSTFPHSQKVIKEVFEGCDAETTRKVVCENAAKLYKVKGAGVKI